VTTAQLGEVERLHSQLVDVVHQLRDFCDSSNFRGDRGACGNVADQTEAFLAGPFVRLLERARAGDEHAYANLVESGSKILVAATGTPFDLHDNTVTGLVEAIAQDARDAAGEVGAGFGVGAVVAAIVAAVVFLPGLMKGGTRPGGRRRRRRR
jgi:hypothetical protein